MFALPLIAVVIMDSGAVHYFGPWNEDAQKLLSKYLPVSHLLAAAGGAEQPRDDKPKAKKAPEEAKKDTMKEEDKVGQRSTCNRVM
jgi:hypothetical protein